MTRLFAAVIGSTALLAAAPAFAGSCEQLAGGRWLFHLEGGAPAHVETGFMDFRDGVLGGLIFRASGPTPFPNGVLSTPFPHGSSMWIRSGECLARPGNVARLSFPIAMDLAVSIDGKTAVMTGNLGGGGLLTGWATREPASPARPAGPVAQQRPRQPPRN